MQHNEAVCRYTYTYLTGLLSAKFGNELNTKKNAICFKLIIALVKNVDFRNTAINTAVKCLRM